jgi:hypothetical protein
MAKDAGKDVTQGLGIVGGVTGEKDAAKDSTSDNVGYV